MRSAGFHVFRILTALTLLLLTGASPRAEQPHGADDPVFRAALSLWLQDDDAAAMPELERLARQDNDAARQFLRLLRLRPDLWTPWLHGLTEDERRAFFRPLLPDGPKYGGWYRRGAEPAPISLLRSKPLEESFVGDMIALMEQGEPRLAFARLAGALQFKPLAETTSLGEHPALPEQLAFMEKLSGFIRSGRLPEADAYGPEPDTPAGARMQQALYFSWAMFLMVDGDYGHEIPTDTMRKVITVLYRVASELPYITADPTLGDPETAGKSAWPERTDRTLDWLRQSAEAGHYRTMCTERCSNEFDRCLLTSFFANGGYAVLYSKQTPSERLIPAPDFAASLRGAVLPVRRVAHETLALGKAAGPFLASLRKGSACYQKQVTREMIRLEKGE